MRLKRTPLRARAIFAVQIDSACLVPVTATFEMTFQDGMRRSLPTSVSVRPQGSVFTEIIGMLDPGERPVALITRVHGDGVDLEVSSNLDRGAPSSVWPIAVAGIAVPATSAIVAWYFASHAARTAIQPPRLPSLPKPDAFTPPAALQRPPSDFQPLAQQSMLPAIVDQPAGEVAVATAPAEPIRVGHDRVAPERAGEKRLRRVVAPAPAPWSLGPITSNDLGRAALRTAGLAGTAAVTAITAVAAIAFVHPQIADLAMPAPIPRGSHVDVLYRLAGIGNGDYSLIDADGTPLDSGTLASRQGVLRIDIPNHVTGKPVTLRVAMSGPFGDAQRELSADVLATPGPAFIAHPASTGPHIDMLSLDRDTIAGGELLTVRYHVTPEVGAVMLADATGAVLASAALSSSGKSVLRVPPSDRARDVAVIVRATGNGGAVETRLPLRVEPGPRANAPSALSPVAPSFSDEGSEMAIITKRVVSGEPIRLHVPLPYDSLTIQLLDPQRHVVAERQYATAYDPVRIEAPTVTAPTTFELHASVTNGNAVNIGVYFVTVVPAAGASAAAAQ